MLKYLAILVLVFGLAVYVSVKDKHAAEDAARNATKLNKSAPSGIAHEYHPQDYVTDAEWNLPSWYGFFRWPIGVTTWAIILTLLAIAEQTQETRKSAEAARETAEASSRQITAMKNKERARLALSPETLKDIEFGSLWQDAEIRVENLGYSHAFNVRFTARCEITMSEVEPTVTKMDSTTISIVRADGVKPPKAQIAIYAADEMWKNVIHAGAQDLFVHLWGEVEYEDVFGDVHPITFQYVFKILKLGDAAVRNGIDVFPIISVFDWKKCTHPEHNREA